MIILVRLKGQAFFEHPVLPGYRLSSIDLINPKDDTTKKEAKMNKKEFLFSIFTMALVIIFLSIPSGYADDVKGVTGDTIKLGMIADMTGPTASDISAPVVAAVRNYFGYLNKTGGINGKKVQLRVEDDRYSIPGAIASFKKLVFKNEVFAIVGPVQTAGTMALSRQIKEAKIPLMSYSPALEVVNPVQRYIFTPGTVYEDDIKIIFKYIMQNLKAKNPKIAILYPDIEFGKVGLRAARREAKSYGLELHDEVLGLGAIDATSQVLNIKKFKPDFVILHHMPLLVVAFLRDARKYNLAGTFIGSSVACSEYAIEMAKKAAKNFYATHFYNAWYDDTPGIVKMREITIKMDPDKGKSIQPRHYCIGWGSALIWHEGMKRAGRDLNREKMVESLESIKGLDTQGLSFPVTYGPDDHRGLDHSRLFKADVDKGIFIPVTDWIKAPSE